MYFFYLSISLFIYAMFNTLLYCIINAYLEQQNIPGYGYFTEIAVNLI